MTGSAQLSPAQFPAALLQALGLPTSPVWQAAVNAWTTAEGPNGGWAWQNNNPLNAGCSGFGSQGGQTGCAEGTNSKGEKVYIASYSSLSAAIANYAATIKTGAFGYSAITGAKTPVELTDAISASQWAGS